MDGRTVESEKSSDKFIELVDSTLIAAGSKASSEIVFSSTLVTLTEFSLIDIFSTIGSSLGVINSDDTSTLSILSLSIFPCLHDDSFGGITT